MRGVYTAEIEIASVSAGKTIILIEAPSTKTIEILSTSITNMDNDVSEQLEAGLFRVTTEGSPSGTSITPTKHEVGDSASGITATGDLSAEPTTYDSTAIDRQGFNNLGGYFYDPIPEEKPTIPPGGLLGLRLLSAPDTAFKCAAKITFREIG